jgi:kynurenine formamidase
MTQEIRMKTIIEIKGQEYEADLSSGHDISLGISPDGSTSCFGAAPPVYHPMKGEGWIARVSEGGSVNAFEVSFNPHAHGTHTECLGHISKQHHHLEDVDVASHFISKLITLEPKSDGGDKCITREMIRNVLGDEGEESAVIIRTLPNTKAKKGRNYTGADPAYLEADAVEWLVERGIMHLLIDLPSVDPESDGGALKAHKAFWNWPTFEGREKATITELVYIDDKIGDGLFLLNLQRASFHLDCAPSRPILHPVQPKTTTK